MPRIFGVIYLLLALSGCTTPISSQPAANFCTGFWFWFGSSSREVRIDRVLDVLYVHAGSIRKDEPPPYLRQKYEPRWIVYGNFPEHIPAAREHWLVFRYNRQGVPDRQTIAMLASQFSSLSFEARQRQIHLAGVQLDIDSPTGSLKDYADYLRDVRRVLPQGFQLSITALLDWFRPGTAVDRVIDVADEFVPQFYDIANPNDEGMGDAIAAPIDAAKWGPIFNRFGKRFRIGISTFGRARMLNAGGTRGRYWGLRTFGDLAPIEIAGNPAFQMEATRNNAGEAVVSYRAARKLKIGYYRFEPGDTIQFVLATPEHVRSAVKSVRRMGGSMAGVIFFRWPTSSDNLTMQPDEALDAAGVPGARKGDRVSAVNGGCAAVECVDLYFESGSPLSSQSMRYVIRSSAPLDYFLPEKQIPVRMVAPSRLELQLPAYCARGRLHLGRAVSKSRATFEVEASK